MTVPPSGRATARGAAAAFRPRVAGWRAEPAPSLACALATVGTALGGCGPARPASAQPVDDGGADRCEECAPPPDGPSANDAGDAPLRPAYCVQPWPNKLQVVTGTPASPYLVHHPVPDDPNAPTVIFLPGGTGSRPSAEKTWDNYLSQGKGVEAYRVVIPYADQEEFLNEVGRTYQIREEVLECYGGNPAKVHLAGRSNGGLGAFALALGKPDRFATLLGAPGLFPTNDPVSLATLVGHAVFNGVGALDDGWKAQVKATHDALVAAGVDSVHVEFPGEAHTFSAAFDETVFFDFWSKH